MKHRLVLTAEERLALKKKVSSGAAPAREILHAQILLKMAGGRERPTDAAVAKEVGVSSRTVQRVRQRAALEGLDAALSRRPQPPRPQRRKLTDEAEARLVALACSPAPEGRARWSVRLLADRSVELLGLPLSRESVRQALKKTSSSPGSWSAG